MMSQLQKNWYAVYTKPLWEKKVAKLLDKKKIENYCPLAKVQRQWSDRKKILETPLFTSYVFVFISEEEKITILQTEGILNFVYWLKKPAIIQSEEIVIIKRFLSEYTNIKLEKSPVSQHDHVRIINGPLMEREGNVLEVKHKTVKVLLPTLGYTIVAEIEKSNVEILSIFTRGENAVA